MEISLKGKKINSWLIILIFVLVVALLIFLIISLKLEKNNNSEIQESDNREDFLVEQASLELIFNRETYLRENINLLSPEPAVLGGKFYITSIIWPEVDRAIVEYEDGHIALKADVSFMSGSSKVLSFIINQEE